jgi:hypothetical protein
MDKRSSFKDPMNLKMEIEKLISFEEKDGLLKLKKQLEVKTVDKQESLSKYAKVLSCSFTARAKETEMAKGVFMQNKRLPHAT